MTPASVSSARSDVPAQDTTNITHDCLVVRSSVLVVLTVVARVRADGSRALSQQQSYHGGVKVQQCMGNRWGIEGVTGGLPDL